MTRVGFEPTTSRLPISTRSVNPRGVGKSTTAGKPKVKILDIYTQLALPLLSKNLNKIDQNFSGVIR